ncbi:MAG TPA: insulinase family protein, partial [Bryobacteraceae bacterium]
MKVVTIVSLLAVTCLAQDREAPPPLGAPKPFVLPTSDTFTLRNGMKVTLAQYGSVPLVSVRADMAFGKANETADQVWLSALTVQLMREGTQTKTAEQVANEAGRMGGQLDVVGGTDQSTVSLNVLGEFAIDAVRLISDVLRHPKLPESELPRVRNDSLRQLAVQLATPQSQASQAFAAKMFPNHPYGRLFPTEAQLKSYSLADVRKFYDDNIGAQRTHLYVVGR